MGTPRQTAEPCHGPERGRLTLAARLPLGRAAVALLVAGCLASAPPSPSASPVADPPTAQPPSSTAPAPPVVSATPGDSPVPVVSGIACDVDEHTTYHAHAHLNMLFDGELQPIPADVGFGPGCLFWLHTHGPHGVIHVEAPAEAAFTLGQFFDIWGAPLSPTEVAGRAVGPGESLFVFVDGQPYPGDPRGIVLGNLVTIELQVGTQPLEPLPYTFPAEFQ